MPLEPFKCAALASIDSGRIGVAIDQAVARAHHDCVDRPGIEKPRVVTLQIVLIPVAQDGEGDLDSVNVEFRVRESIPLRSSKRYNMRSDGRTLRYNELSPEDHKQTTIETGPRPIDDHNPAAVKVRTDAI